MFNLASGVQLRVLAFAKVESQQPWLQRQKRTAGCCENGPGTLQELVGIRTIRRFRCLGRDL